MYLYLIQNVYKHGAYALDCQPEQEKAHARNIFRIYVHPKKASARTHNTLKSMQSQYVGRIFCECVSLSLSLAPGYAFKCSLAICWFYHLCHNFSGPFEPACFLFISMATMSREQQQSAMTITFRIDHQLLYGSAWRKKLKETKSHPTIYGLKGAQLWRWRAMSVVKLFVIWL